MASADPAIKTKIEETNAGLMNKIDAKLTEYTSTCFEPEDHALYGKIRPLYQEYVRTWEPVRAVSREGKNQEAALRYLTEVDPTSIKLRQAIRDLEEYKRTHGMNTAGLAKAGFKSVRFWTWSIFLLALIIGPSLTFIVVQGLNGTLLSMATELGLGAEQTASASGQVSSASHSLAQGASEQAAALEETSAATEEINSMTQKNADNSQAAANLTHQVDSQVKAANQNLTHMVTAMTDINSSSENIAKIIKVIDEIAFQTNILALNAAVEAARAGEAGMGFAVVADEVRNLAQRCSQAARDTGAIIDGSIAKSKDGTVKLSEVEQSIRSITTTASQLRILVDEVHVSSQEQARGIGQIAKAVIQMEKVTQSNAASAEESASAAEELNAQAAVVKEAVGKLKSLVSRDATRSTTGNRPIQRSTQQFSTRAPALSASSKKPGAAATITLEDDFTEF